MAVLGILVFAAAFAAAVAVFAFTLVPALPRIIALLSGEGDPGARSMPVARPRMLRAAA